MLFLKRKGFCKVSKKILNWMGKNILWKRNKTDSTEEEEWKLVVPYSQRKDILIDAHDEVWAGHFGTEKTLKKIAAKKWWPGLYKEVKQWCDSRGKCAIKVKVIHFGVHLHV